MGLFDRLKKSLGPTKKQMMETVKAMLDLMEMDIKDIWGITDTKQFVLAMSGWIHRKSNFGTRLSALTDEERVVYIVVSFRGEVNNGGFQQFLYSSSGAFAGELLFSLSAIGAKRTAELYRGVLESFPWGIPMDIVQRRKRLEEALTEDILKTIDFSDDEFFKDPDDMDQLLYRYIMNNQHRII